MSKEIDKTKEIKTIEDLDNKENKDIKLTETELKEDPFEQKYTQLKIDFDNLTKERDTYKEKYNRALEENNRLFNRLTGTPPEPTANAMDSLLKLKGVK